MAEWWRTALGIGREPSAEQSAAIVAPHLGRRSVNAGAGTGKTSTLALRALWLIESERVRADRIVVVTFTNKAAAEIGARVADTIDRAIANGARFVNDGRGVRCSTIHALASDVRREFTFDLRLEAAPVGIGDSEAHAIFHDAFGALLRDELGVDASCFPLAESNLLHLERDLGKLALRLKNHGISPDDFERGALDAAGTFGAQTWGQLYTCSAKTGKPTRHYPKDPVTREDIALELRRERANVAVVAALMREFDRRLRRCGAATYGDLIGDTTRLLSERPDLVARLRARWRYVLLDESQDTSDLQLAFIDTVFGKPGEAGASGMMPVGDFRQAIYGFNGASENVMQRLGQLDEEEFPLRLNRRSYQEIVDAAHAVLESEGIVEPKHKLRAHVGPGTLDCVRLENFDNGKSLKERVASEAQAIAKEVARLLADGSAQPSDIAILVRRRTHATAYLRGLNHEGIFGALDRRSSLLAADEIRDLLAWMGWILDLRDSSCAVRVLQSPLCGLSDASTIEVTASKTWLDDFFRFDFSSHEADTRARLADVRARLVSLLPAASLPLPAALAHMMAALPIAASYVHGRDRDGAQTIGAQAIVNLASFETLAREFADEHPAARLRDFALDIERRILYDDDVSEAELDSSGVRILTVHQAKGLEWPYVFVACSTSNQYGVSEPTDRVVNYDVASRAFALKHDVDGRETFHWYCLKTEHDPSDGRRLEEGPRKLAALREQARIFYVALTRAKKRVYISAPAPEGKNEASYLRSIRDWARKESGLAIGGFSQVTHEAERAPYAGFMTPLTVAPALPALAPTADEFKPAVSFTSISAFETCPRQARYRYRLKVPDLHEKRLRFVGFDGNDTPQTASAARRGSLVHRALELWGRSRIARGAATYNEAFASAQLEFADVTDTALHEARANGERAVEALNGYTLLEVEAAFALDVAGTTLVGSVDVIARDPSGTLTVIDYKTGKAAGEKYALQLALYRRVAQERLLGERAEACILRLTPEAAIFEEAVPLRSEDVDRSVAAIDGFASDAFRVGAWCHSCAYQGSPCSEGASATVRGTPPGAPPEGRVAMV